MTKLYENLVLNSVKLKDGTFSICFEQLFLFDMQDFVKIVLVIIIIDVLWLQKN